MIEKETVEDELAMATPDPFLYARVKQGLCRYTSTRLEDQKSGRNVQVQ